MLFENCQLDLAVSTPLVFLTYLISKFLLLCIPCFCILINYANGEGYHNKNHMMRGAVSHEEGLHPGY